MRYVNMLSILVLVFLVGCKQYEFESEAEGEAKVAEADAAVAAQKAAEEVSKVTGLGVEEIKALSKEDLERLSEEVKKDSEKSRASARGVNGSAENAKKAELIKEIKSTAEKFEKAFKTLVSEGYGGPVADAVKGNMDMGLKKLGLVEKLVGIANGSGKKEAMKKAVEEFGGDTGSCKSDINGIRPPNNGSNKCMKNLMGNVRSSFSGVENNIRDNLETASAKFKSSLQSLVQAASDISSAAGLISALFS
ncbi:hypothetical protein DB313_05085 (plasmid) [Borrelia turcica IST7]|uniref:Uncharacterized protein n=1 Tax=Borrelia turcica IST7 TaxID=1104446 RepID=A0A386PMU9_9SPIR|nr:hypothetical protein [Borrelia turcica]AYE36874.1 hypothetical protein DB313_05085 [Borrelia turcica IST7]